MSDRYETLPDIIADRDRLRRDLTEANALLREAHGMQWNSDVEYADWRRRINEHLGGEREDNR